MKRFTEWFLHLAEVIYLEAHGWRPITRVGSTYWMPPEGYFWRNKQEEEHAHGHAVNSQKSAIGNQRYEERIWKER